MQTTKAPKLKTKRSKISYAKWGYVFIAPFFLAYALFHFAPQLLTIYNSFFENYREGLTQVGPNFVGLKNYITLFTPDKNGTIDILKYAGNTIALWVGGAIPQVVISLMLACFFTSYRLKIKGQQFFKTVIYMPNLIMASAFAMLFYMLFSNVGPINQILTQLGWIDMPIDFFNIRFTVRGLICLMNFLMWFGNTTILLMAGIMGIDQSLFEAANIDGATSLQVFFQGDAAASDADFGLHGHHRTHRRSADVRRAAGADQRARYAEPHLNDARHVPQQLSQDEQELWYVRRNFRRDLHHHRSSEPCGVQIADEAGRKLRRRTQ